MTWSLQLLARAAVIGLLALSTGAAAGWMVSHERPATEPPPSAGPEVMALLAPLVSGSRLGEFTLSGVAAVERGVIRIALQRGGRHSTLGIALVGKVPSPVTVGPYAIFYFGPDDSDLADAAARLGQVLRTHSSAPIPAGLAPLR